MTDLKVLFTCSKADSFTTTETRLYYNHKHSLTGKSFSHNKFLASGFPLYLKSSVSFKIELFLCIDIELNPCLPTNNDHSNPVTKKDMTVLNLIT